MTDSKKIEVIIEKGFDGYTVLTNDNEVGAFRVHSFFTTKKEATELKKALLSDDEEDC